MGYCIYQTDSNFSIKKENFDKALIDLKNKLNSIVNYKDSIIKGFCYVFTTQVLKSCTLVDALEACRWEVDIDVEGNINGISFTGEKLGDDMDIFDTIAKYVEKDSYIEIRGEEGDLWRWIFDGENCVERECKIVWSDYMRDPNRIQPLLDNFKELWEKKPDLRFIQLIHLLLSNWQSDGFYIEDEEVEEIINKLKERS